MACTRNKSVVVEDDVYLLQVSRYIHLNPIGPGLATRPEDYRWSSARYFLDGRLRNPILKTSKVLSLLSANKAKARRQYREHLDSGLDQETEKFFSAQRQKPIFGSDQFVEELKATLPDDPELPDTLLLTKAMPK